MGDLGVVFPGEVDECEDQSQENMNDFEPHYILNGYFFGFFKFLYFLIFFGKKIMETPKSEKKSLLEKLNDPNHNVNSKFLKEYYEENRRINSKKTGFNPRDPQGRRLSEFWKFSKKIICFFRKIYIIDQATQFL